MLNDPGREEFDSFSVEEDEFWMRSAEGAAKNPEAWGFTALRLKRAADALRDVVEDDFKQLERGTHGGFRAWVEQPPRIPVSPVFMMVAGMAIECLVKGIWVASDPAGFLQDPRQSKSKAILRKEVAADHELEVYFCRAGLASDLNEGVKHLLARLSVFVTWAGRYPISKSADHMRPTQPGADPPATMYAVDFALFDSLFEGLYRKLRDESERRRAIDELAESKSKAERRQQLLSTELALLRKRVEDGVTYFETDTPSEVLENEGDYQVACCACHAQMALNTRRPGAICRCGTLYFGSVGFNGFRRALCVESYSPGEEGPERN